MLIAAYAPALAAATLRRAPPLWALFIAAQLPDIAFGLLALAGIEHYAVAPFYTAMSPLWLYDAAWTHSLLGTLGWAAAFGIAVRLAGGGKDAAWIGGGVAAAHWPFEVLVRPADLTLAGGGGEYGRRLGLGLWNHPYLAMPLLLALVFVALTFYAGRTRPGGRAGTVALVLLAAATTGFQLREWLAPMPRAAADPAPASLTIAALAATTILTVLAGWCGALRSPCPARPALAPSPGEGSGDGR